MKIRILGLLKQNSTRTFLSGKAFDLTFEVQRSTRKSSKLRCQSQPAVRFVHAANPLCNRATTSTLIFENRTNSEKSSAARSHKAVRSDQIDTVRRAEAARGARGLRTLIIIHFDRGLGGCEAPLPLFPGGCPLRTPTQAGSLCYSTPSRGGCGSGTPVRKHFQRSLDTPDSSVAKLA
jgi:hypothetical protein